MAQPPPAASPAAPNAPKSTTHAARGVVDTIQIAPPAVSRYNNAYYCTVEWLGVTPTELCVSFAVRGDGSLGPLQNAESSTLHIYGGTARERRIVKASGFDCGGNANVMISGTLRYERSAVEAILREVSPTAPSLLPTESARP